MITVKGYTKISKSAKNIEGQAINELETNGYKVWTGMPRRKRPVWLGSLKTPQEAKKEKEFEDEVMRVTNTIWDYIGDNVDYVVLEKSKQIFVPASVGKKAYYRFDPRGEPIQVEPPGGAEHPDPKYKEVVRRLGEEEFKEEEAKPERREFQSRGSGEGRRKYRSARSSRSRSTIRRIGKSFDEISNYVVLEKAGMPGTPSMPGMPPRPGLVAVKVTVNGPSGPYQAIRWETPEDAQRMIKEGQALGMQPQQGQQQQPQEPSAKVGEKINLGGQEVEVTAVGRDGVTARDEEGQKHLVTHENVKKEKGEKEPEAKEIPKEHETSKEPEAKEIPKEEGDVFDKFEKWAKKEGYTYKNSGTAKWKFSQIHPEAWEDLNDEKKWKEKYGKPEKDKWEEMSPEEATKEEPKEENIYDKLEKLLTKPKPKREKHEYTKEGNEKQLNEKFESKEWNEVIKGCNAEQRKAVESVLLSRNVPAFALDGLSELRFTTQEDLRSTSGFAYDVGGLYTTETKKVLLWNDVLEGKMLGKEKMELAPILIHELGHHLDLSNSDYQENFQPYWSKVSKSFQDVVSSNLSKEEAGNKLTAVADAMGLNPYSLVSKEEFLAECFMTTLIGDESSRTKLGAFLGLDDVATSENLASKFF